MPAEVAEKQKKFNRASYPKDKGETIAQAKEWYARSTGVVFTDYRGLKVSQLRDLRSNLRAKGGDMHVIKNTLFRIAAGDDVEKMPAELHNGPTAVVFLYENESDCAKALFDFAKTNKALEIKGGFISGKALTAKDVEDLSKLPPREVLIAQVIGAIAAPLSTLVGTIEALYADPVRVIGAVADKVAEGSPIPAPVADAEPAPAEAPAEAEATTGSDEAEAAPEPQAEAPAEADAQAETPSE